MLLFEYLTKFLFGLEPVLHAGRVSELFVLPEAGGGSCGAAAAAVPVVSSPLAIRHAFLRDKLKISQ